MEQHTYKLGRESTHSYLLLCGSDVRMGGGPDNREFAGGAYAIKGL